MKGFAKRFNSLRLEGETQKEFAERLGLTQASISRYLAGYSPDREALRRIAMKTGVSVDWMLTGKEADPNIAPGTRPAKPAKAMSEKEVLDTALSFLDHLKSVPPHQRQAMKLMLQDMFENKEHLKALLEYWNGLRLQSRTSSNRRKRKK